MSQENHNQANESAPKRDSRAFPKTARLRSPKEFEAAMGGQRRSHGDFSARALWNGKEARLGLIVGARFEPISPRRNAIKRAAREAFREMRAGLPPVDIALRLAKKGGKDESLAQLAARARQEIRALLALCAQLRPPAAKEPGPEPERVKKRPRAG